MDKLKFINEQMDILSVPYEYGEWTSAIIYPYSVGEVTEEPIVNEDGSAESTLLLTVFNRLDEIYPHEKDTGSYLELERIKEKIRKHFNPICGLRATTDSGAIAVFFDGSFPVPTGEANLKRIQINLTIKEWKGDI